MAVADRVEGHFLSMYENDLYDIFKMYLDDINPLVVLFEISKNEFPVEIQNEIRAMFSHLARVATAENVDDAKRNIEKIKSHTKRALLDCFKYCCVIYTDKYTNFFKQYDGVDLSYLDEGKFLPEVHQLNNAACQSLQEAKMLEATNASDEELYDAYQVAFNNYGQLSDRLDSISTSAEYLKHKATKKDLMAKISFIVGAVGLLVGIIGVVITLVLA